MKLKKTIIFLIIIIAAFLITITIIIKKPGDQPPTCNEYYASMENAPAGASAWCEAGTYFQWKSTLEVNDKFDALSIFSRCIGDKRNPAILMIHGFPTSSYDFVELIAQLQIDYYICVLDTPGYGFSDKPRKGFKYSMLDDARLVDTFIRDVAKLDSFTLLTHDKGDSVGLALLQIYQAYENRPYTINNHIILNGSIYLPLAQLSRGQKLMLNPVTGPLLTSLIPGSRMASGMSSIVYTPELSQAEVSDLASIFGYQDGIKVLHETIKYLNERMENEITWLKILERSDIPTTLIWGELDPVATTAIADYVWETYMRNRKAPSTYWRLACANHYIQNDQPEMLAALIRGSIKGSIDIIFPDADCQPYLVE